MSILRHQYSTIWLPSGSIEKRRYALAGTADAQNRPALIYSSPWPWALALAISVTIWGVAGWVIWTFV
jgi:hypothetical protein